MDRKQDTGNGFPKEWARDADMEFMFGALPPSRDSDPSHWNQKLHFWESAIRETQRTLIRDRNPSKRCLTFTLRELRSRFTRKMLVPRHLPKIVSHLIDKKGSDSGEKIMLAAEVMAPASTPIRETIASITGALYSLTFGGGGSPDAPGENEELLSLDLVDQCARALHERVIREADTPGKRLISVEDLARDFRFTVEDLEIIIHRMKASGLACYVPPVRSQKDLKRSRIVKFAARGERVRLYASDRYTAMFQEALKDIHKEIYQQEDRIKVLLQRVRALIKEGRKKNALTLLRSKKLAEQRINTAMQQAANVEEVFQKLQQVHNDQEVLAVLRKGNFALKKTIEAEGLDPDSIADVLSDIQVNISHAEEVAEALSAVEGDKEEEEFLEDEFEKMVREDQTEAVENAVEHQVQTKDDEKKSETKSTLAADDNVKLTEEKVKPKQNARLILHA